MQNKHYVIKRLCVFAKSCIVGKVPISIGSRTTSFFKRNLGSLVLEIAYPYQYLGLWVTSAQSLGFEVKMDHLLPAHLFHYTKHSQVYL